MATTAFEAALHATAARRARRRDKGRIAVRVAAITAALLLAGLTVPGLRPVVTTRLSAFALTAVVAGIPFGAAALAVALTGLRRGGQR